MNLSAIEIKAFVPARDLKRSADFYLALGFEIPWINETMALAIPPTLAMADRFVDGGTSSCADR
jgi:hypothetical protein